MTSASNPHGQVRSKTPTPAARRSASSPPSPNQSFLLPLPLPMASLSSVNGSPQDMVNKSIIQEAEIGHVPVHTFNPDASPQEKAAAAGQGREKLKSVNQDPVHNEHGERLSGMSSPGDPSSSSLRPPYSPCSGQGQLRYSPHDKY